MRNATAALGRVLITLGILILLFVGYQLWGTGIYTARAQSDLERDFQEQLAAGTDPSIRIPEGDAVAQIVIPKIGADWMVVEGVGVADLQRGPGHFPDTPLPGEIGNAAIAGHRTTYGAPFHRLDELDVGDDIIVTTLAGTYYYVLEESLVVSPTQVEVLLPESFPDEPVEAELTLTTCHPKYSAAQRLVVKAKLDPDRSDAPRESDRELTGDAELAEGLSGEAAARFPAGAWGAVALAVGGLWWLTFHRYPRWTTWFGGALPFAVTLFLFYTYLERALGPYTVPYG